MSVAPLLSPAKVAGLRRALAAVADVPGDLAELGVYRGGTARVMARACPGRTLRLFDTFAGIPWDGYDEALDMHRPGDWAARLDEVRAYLSDCPNVVFHPGLFPHTAAGDCFALVHLDADLYASTLAGLDWFWPRLSVGGAIVLDDWRWHFCPGVEKSVTDYFGASHPPFDETVEHQLTITKS